MEHRRAQWSVFVSILVSRTLGRVFLSLHRDHRLRPFDDDDDDDNNIPPACADSPFSAPVLEYRNKTITKIFGGNARNGCYFLAASIFFAGMFRDSLYAITTLPTYLTLPVSPSNILLTRFQKAIAEQPHARILPEPLNVIIPAVLVGLGQLFVFSSTWQLGITGTFLGDYFGILMDHRVEGFPFNVLTDPMYVGSTMTFVGGSLWYESPAGLLISLYVYVTYVIALRFEGCVPPFLLLLAWFDRKPYQ